MKLFNLRHSRADARPNKRREKNRLYFSAIPGIYLKVYFRFGGFEICGYCFERGWEFHYSALFSEAKALIKKGILDKAKFDQ